MSLKIERKNDNRAVKCVAHRIADIPGGVTINVSKLGGSALFEGTPIGVGSSGMYEVCKTAQVVSEANSSATTYDVAKGHHFKVGDRFATSSYNGQTIKSIDYSNPEKDVIEVNATLGGDVHVGDCAFESSGANKTLKVVPCAVTGSNEDVKQGHNLFVSAWVIGVVNEKSAPIVNKSIKDALKAVIYI